MRRKNSNMTYHIKYYFTLSSHIIQEKVMKRNGQYKQNYKNQYWLNKTKFVGNHNFHNAFYGTDKSDNK